MERQETEKLISAIVSTPGDRSTNIWFSEGELRTLWRILIFFAFFVLVEFAGSAALYVFPIPQNELTFEILFLCGSLLATLLTLRLIDGKTLTSIGLPVRMISLRQFVFGASTSIVGIGALTGIELVFGFAEVRLFQQSIGNTVGTLSYGLLLFLFVAFAEEILARGYCFQSLIHGTNVRTAVVLTSLFFALMHYFNPNISLLPAFNIFIAGVWFAVAFLRTGQLWFSIGLHFGWNYAEGTLIGFPVSGTWNQSIFRSIETGPDWITGGTFGPEGGVLVTLMVGVGIAMLWSNPYLRMIGVAAESQRKFNSISNEKVLDKI